MKFLNAFLFFIVIVLCSDLRANSTSLYRKCPRQCICDVQDKFRRATCSNQNIVDIDVGVPKDVQVYVLSRNVINEIENFAFRNLKYTSLVEVNLSYNLIFWIGIHAFAGLEHLKKLNLSTNRLQIISKDIFWYNQLLETLDLSGNHFLNFGNEPFLVHANLMVLNLSNSHITFIPEITFTELPKLEILDLNNNFMIELQISVFSPLHHLKRLSLKENPWKCTLKLKKLEEWIIQKDTSYEKQCPVESQKMPQRFEKIISAVDVQRERQEVDLGEIWNMDDIEQTTIKSPMENNTDISLSFYDQIEEQFPSFWALLAGFQLGLLLGIVSTYCWMANLCKCKSLSCKLPQTRRQLRRARNVEEMDTRTSLLWTTILNANRDTPPIVRRQHSNSVANRGLYCRSTSWEIFPSTNNDSFHFATNVLQNAERSETPPPPYQQCTRLGAE